MTSSGPTDPRSDPALVQAANDGDVAAFDALYRRHRDWVVRVALRLSGDRDAALDILQDAFTDLLRRFPGFTLTASSLRAYLYPVVRNLVLARRREMGRQRVAADVLDGVPAAPAAGCTDQQMDLAVVLADLPAAHRDAVYLRFVDGLSLVEIAEAQGIPVGTVKSRLHNALATLRADPRTKSYFEP